MAELVDMAGQFKGLPMADLIGGPLAAACDAQVRLANATAEFIKTVGFLPPPDAKQGDGSKATALLPRNAAFKFTRPQPIMQATKPGDAIQVAQEEVTLDVPLLALVKVPNLSITQVDVTFDMEVKSAFQEKGSTDASASIDATLGWSIAKVHIQGSVAAHQEHTRSSDSSAKYHVSVHAQDSGMPEGLARVMDLLQTAIAPKEIKPVK